MRLGSSVLMTMSARLEGPSVGAAWTDVDAAAELRRLASRHGLDVAGGTVRRTSSRFCLGVEHGDYNGCPLFGVGTDRYIWVGFKPNDSGRCRLVSANFEHEGVVDFESGSQPPPLDPATAASWARFPYGVDWALREAGHIIGKSRGFDAAVVGNIPGGGMSRSASLCLNLVLSLLDVNGVVDGPEGLAVVDLARRVENAYIGSPCGDLDQIMIYYAKEGFGTRYDPAARSVTHVPLGAAAPDFCFVALDTGTDRPGLDKSTYVVRRRECDALAADLRAAGAIGPAESLGAVRDPDLFRRILQGEAGGAGNKKKDPAALKRLTYLFHAQKRFDEMLAAWQRGDVATLGALFRQDGIGLRDDYDISGPELETMCDIARTVDGVYGERMLGGGDKGAAGAIVAAEAVDTLRAAVAAAYPKSRPSLKDKFAVHVVKPCNGITVIPGILD